MRRGFTLIELLVVVSIIALLIAILLPALSSAKYTANITRCQVAVRSIATVQLSYAIDSKDYFPAGRPRYEGGGSWFTAMQSGAQVRSWEIYNPGSYDLRPIYYDYMQNNNQEAVMHCPMKSEKFFENNQDDRILSYMLFTTNNWKTKHFYYESIGAYERLGVRGALVAHPAPNGSIYEQFAEINDAGGHIVDETQSSPNNFADADGSVHTYKINASSYLDKDTWVVNDGGNHRSALMPRDLAR